jgi:hypothetical protein
MGIGEKAINQYESTPRGMLELWDCVQDVWWTIFVEVFRGLYESMPRQIVTILASLERKMDLVLNVSFIMIVKNWVNKLNIFEF